jgi:hypothetical protein
MRALPAASTVTQKLDDAQETESNWFEPSFGAGACQDPSLSV